MDPFSYGRADVIDEYESLVWTERHINPGELRLIVPASVYNYDLLRPPVLLGTNNSRELMLADTRLVEDGMITVTGKTMETFLDERWITPFTVTDTPGGILGALFGNMTARPEYAHTWIAGLQTGYLEPGDGTEVEEEFQHERAYTAMLRIAKKYGLNIALYRVSAEFGGYQLSFSAHLGEDKTSDQNTNKLVQFSPGLGNFANTKDLTSEAKSTTVVIAIPPLMVFDLGGGFSQVAEPVKVSKVPDEEDEDYNPLRERVLEIDCTDITDEQLGPTGTADFEKMAKLYEIMESRALRELRKQSKTDMVDGEITSESLYKYKEDNPGDSFTTYGLGDRVEVGGHFGIIRKGLITEHVRTHDRSSGSGRSYPVVSDQRGPVLQQGLVEQVLAHYSFSDEDFWSSDDMTKARPKFWKADEGTMKAPGEASLAVPRSDVLRFRFRWGMNPDDSRYDEYIAPNPPKPPDSVEVQALINFDVEGPDEMPILQFNLESTAGGDFGFYMFDEEEWFIYADNGPGPYSRYWSAYVLQVFDEMFPSDPDLNWHVNGWMAITQLYPGKVAVDK